MRTLLIITILSLSCHSNCAQSSGFWSEIIPGTRSFFYQGQLTVKLNKKMSCSNLTLLDREYFSDKNFIYFTRNQISYNHSSKISSNFALGVKNPGNFLTLSFAYKKVTSSFVASISVGVTYQKSLFFEPSALLRKQFTVSDKLAVFIQLFATGSFNSTGINRGLQQMRVGINTSRLEFGAGINTDQFNSSSKTLYNSGIFLKTTISK